MSTQEEKINSLIISLHKINAVKFGSFKLKSGVLSPVYFDLRLVISYPQLLNTIGEIIWARTEEKSLEFDLICGVPYTALPIASVISSKQDIPMILKRKEQKTYGTGKILEGNYSQGDTCLVIEDVATTGSSIVETVDVIREHGIVVTDVIVILDRGQGTRTLLQSKGITMHSLVEVRPMLETLGKFNLLTPEVIAKTSQFLNSNLELEKTKSPADSPSSDDGMCQVAKRLMEIILKKKSNLCLSADMDNWTQVLELVEAVGPQICLVKTHVDSMDFKNYDEIKSFLNKLVELSGKYEFLLMEDRKFADIGATVQKQLKGQPFEIHKWAQLVTAHGISGPGILKCLQESIAVVLIAEMSSEGNLATKLPGYKSEILQMTHDYESAVAGFVSQSRVEEKGYPNYFLQFTPGVSLDNTADGLGQQYNTVENAISRGADVIIVGRGILGKPKQDWVFTAERYRTAAWTAWSQKFAVFPLSGGKLNPDFC